MIQDLLEEAVMELAVLRSAITTPGVECVTIFGMMLMLRSHVDSLDSKKVIEILRFGSLIIICKS